jgi:hypothetical protein
MSGLRQGVRAAVVAVLALALAPGPARAAAFGPEALPSPIWWRDRPPTSMATEPLAAFDETRAFSLRSEWAPLYAGPDGARIEQARRSLRLASGPGPWRAAIELVDQGSVARGGESAWWVGAEQPLTSRGTFALARHGRRLEVAASLDNHGSGQGFAADGRLRPLPGLVLSAGGSSIARVGNLHVRWEDVDVLAAGRWHEEAAHAALEYRSAGGFGVALERRWIEPNRSDERSPGGDEITPSLRWRTTGVGLRARGLGASWIAEAQYGEGEQGLRVYRDGARYLSISGPVSSTLLTLAIQPARVPLLLRAFGGGWRGSANGSLALWPFNALGAASGSFRIARSTAALDHWGVSLERPPHLGAGVDGGLALWSIAPRATYESWQGTWLALVRSDQSAGETPLRSVLAVGGRLAAGVSLSGVRLRLEAVQWVPVRAERALGAAGASQVPGSDASAGLGAHARESGGTILRLSLEPTR